MLDENLAKRITNSVDAGLDEVIDFLAKLVGFPSLRGQESTAQDFMARAFRERGYSIDRWKLTSSDQ